MAAPEIRPFQFANFSRSTLAGDISAAATELSVQEGDGALFPEVDYSYDQICSLIALSSEGFEVMYATAKSGDTFTIERGKEGTTALPFSAGDTIIHSVTKGFLEFVRAANVSTPAAAVTLDGEQVADDFVLTWTAATFTGDDALLRYDIYRNVDSGTFSKVGESTTLSFTDTSVDLGSGVTYGYYVVPVGTLSGAGTQSNTIFNSIDVMYAISGGGDIAVSFDGKAFSIVADASVGDAGFEPINGEPFVWCRGMSLFVMGGDDNQILTSPDIATWTVQTGAWGARGTTTDDIDGMATDGTIVVATSGEYTTNCFQWSSDGVTWNNGTLDGGTSTTARVTWIKYIEELDKWIGGYQNGDDTERGLFISDDGKAWTSVAIDPGAGFTYVQAGVYDPINEVILLGTSRGLYRSADAGATWAFVSSDINGQNVGTVSQVLDWSPTFERLVHLSGTGVYHYSTDGGDTWVGGTDFGDFAYRAGFASSDSLGVDAYCGLRCGYVSTDGTTLLGDGNPMGVFNGVGWKAMIVAPRKVFTADVIGVGPGPVDESRMMRASFDSLADVNRDHGQVLGIDPITTRWDFVGLAYKAANETILALSDGTDVGTDTERVFRSTDAGLTWEKLSGLSSSYDWSNLIYIPELDRWFATRDTVGASDTDAIYYSDDDGDTWTAATMASVSFDVFDIAYAPSHNGGSGRLYAAGARGGSTGGAYSDDDGATWTDMSTITSMAGVAYSPTLDLVVMNSGGSGYSVWSDNEGATWNQALTHPSVRVNDTGGKKLIWVPWWDGTGAFFAIGSSEFMYATDGKNWTDSIDVLGGTGQSILHDSANKRLYLFTASSSVTVKYVLDGDPDTLYQPGGFIDFAVDVIASVALTEDQGR